MIGQPTNGGFRYPEGCGLDLMVTLDHSSLASWNPDSPVKSQSFYIKDFRAQVCPDRLTKDSRFKL